MATHSSTLPGKSHGQRSLAECSPWGRRVGPTEGLRELFRSLVETMYR